MRNPLVLLASLTISAVALLACSSSPSSRSRLDAALCSLDAGNSHDASVDAGRRSDASVDAGVHDAQVAAAVRCNVPLNCGPSGCPKYQPLSHCPAYGQVREGECGWGIGLRLRVSFDGGGEHIEYWETDTGNLVAIDRGSDVVEFCNETSTRVLEGDLKRIEACEASRTAQKIICAGESDDAGAGDAG